MRTVQVFLAAAVVAVLAFSHLSFAKEFPIGERQTVNGMEIAAVYLQPVEMDPMFMEGRQETDIHLEADIHAAKGNKNGFGAGEWVPYLLIRYTLINIEKGGVVSGMLEPMVASDGPHYGAQIKMPGPGKYKVIYYINPPNYNRMTRHTDKETGVGEWWAPFKAEWEFTYLGFGKKGGY